jgi:uracil-DNA glycosylase family 4
MKRNPLSDLIWRDIRDPDCTRCGLHETAQTICLLGDGPVPANGMVVGEAPGFREDEIEIPFSGESGLLLRRTLKDIGLDPRSLYITNTVACRPPDNRTPKTSEIKICSSTFLDQQVAVVKPKVILILGNVALTWALGTKGKITQAEGTTFTKDGIVYVPSRHPSSLLHSRGSDQYQFIVQKFKENLLMFKRELKGSPEEKVKFIRHDDGDMPILPLGPVYVDIETDGLSPFRDESIIWCMAIQHRDQEDAHWIKVNMKKLKQYQAFFRKHPIIPHRATFEGIWITKIFYVIPRFYHDTKQGAYLRNENESSGLKYQAIKYLGVEPWSETQNWEHPDFEVMAPYNVKDTKHGRRIYLEVDLPHLKKFPKQAALLRCVVLPAMEVFTKAIVKGFHIDMEKTSKRIDEAEHHKTRLNGLINQIAGYPINPGSPKQMSKFLFEEMGFDCPIQTDKGANSTSESSLIRIEGDHPVLAHTLEWRQYQKWLGTYLYPWYNRGPILNANYGFTDTDTGRLNSDMVKNKRNEKGLGATLHQCPRDPFIRNIITARDPDWCVVAADLSQVELRLVAHHSKDPTMTEIFWRGDPKSAHTQQYHVKGSPHYRGPHCPECDIHLSTAVSFLKNDADWTSITKEIRKRAKAVNFGFVYGMKPPKFQLYAKDKYGLNLSMRECKDYRGDFFHKYDGLLSWHRRVEAFVESTGWMEGWAGRRRHLPEAYHDSGADEWIKLQAKRQAINSPIQGGGSDLDLLIASLVASQSMTWKYKIDPQKAFIFGAAHDSLLSEVRRDYVKEYRDIILNTVASLPEVTKKYWNFEFLVPILMDVEAYQDCWEGEKIDI